MRIAISQRQDNGHGGMDALEVSYVDYFSQRGATLIPMPNTAAYVNRYFDELAIDAVVLSGGGDIRPALYGGNPVVDGNFSSKRDATEQAMLAIALERDLPVLGICRGMEFINTYFGGKICRSTDIAGGLNHDETRHDVTIAPKAITEALGGDSFEVNSYHRMVIGAGQLSSQLRSFAVASDGTIEGFYHPQHAIGAVVWHPEREVQPHILNEFLIKAFFSRELFWQKRKASTV